MTTLWSGRFDAAPDAAAFEFQKSFRFDRRLFDEDVTGSLAWARALGRAGVLPKSDVLYLLRLQSERATESLLPSVREYTAGYGLTRERGRLLAERALVMHPGPMNRGVEIAAELAALPNSLVTRQVANGVAVRMAVLYLLVGSGADLGA